MPPLSPLLALCLATEEAWATLPTASKLTWKSTRTHKAGLGPAGRSFSVPFWTVRNTAGHHGHRGQKICRGNVRESGITNGSRLKATDTSGEIECCNNECRCIEVDVRVRKPR